MQSQAVMSNTRRAPHQVKCFAHPRKAKAFGLGVVLGAYPAAFSAICVSPGRLRCCAAMSRRSALPMPGVRGMESAVVICMALHLFAHPAIAVQNDINLLNLYRLPESLRKRWIGLNSSRWRELGPDAIKKSAFSLLWKSMIRPIIGLSFILLRNFHPLAIFT